MLSSLAVPGHNVAVPLDSFVAARFVVICLVAVVSLPTLRRPTAAVLSAFLPSLLAGLLGEVVFFVAVFVESGAADNRGFDAFVGFGVRFTEREAGVVRVADNVVEFTVAAGAFVVAAEIFPGGFFVMRRY
jgi:hypothetical protein